MNRMREEFEAWSVETGRTDPLWFGPAGWNESKGEYVLHDINREWVIWQASWRSSRSDMSVQLPHSEYQHHTEVRQALNSAGFTVAPRLLGTK